METAEERTMARFYTNLAVIIGYLGRLLVLTRTLP